MWNPDWALYLIDKSEEFAIVIRSINSEGLLASKYNSFLIFFQHRDWLEKKFHWPKNIHFGTNIQERLLNKPYVNEVTLTGQNPSLKLC